MTSVDPTPALPPDGVPSQSVWPDTPSPPVRLTPTERWVDVFRQWLVPLVLGGWSTWSVIPTPSLRNDAIALALFVLTLAFDLLLTPVISRPRNGSLGWRMAKRAFVFLGGALMGYVLIWLILLLLAASFLKALFL